MEFAKSLIAFEYRWVLWGI